MNINCDRCHFKYKGVDI